MKQSIIFAKFTGKSLNKNFLYEDIKNSVELKDEIIYDSRIECRRAVYKILRQLRKTKGLGEAPLSLSSVLDGEIRKWDGNEIKDGDSDMEDTGNAWIYRTGNYWVLCRHDISEKPAESIAATGTPATTEANIEKVFTEISEKLSTNETLMT